MASGFLGTGKIRFVPSGANPTPVDVAIITGGRVSIDSTVVEQTGDQVYAVDSAITDRKVTGEVQFEALSAGLVAAATGGTVSTGGLIGVEAETASVPTPSGPYTITVAGSATFDMDLGVKDLTTGTLSDPGLTCVASTPATGQYSYAAGVYTFAAADTGHQMAISYTKTSASVGKTIDLVQSAAGSGTKYTLDAGLVVAGTQKYRIRLLAVVIGKLDLALSNKNYAKLTSSFTAFMPSTGTKIGSIYTVN